MQSNSMIISIEGNIGSGKSTLLANLRTVDIRITDSFGDVLPIPENQHVDLVFRVSKPT